jgi:RimJ/RimL family protein N-acetyltransferase
METTHNQFGQPIGWPLEAWTPRPRPPREPMAGRFCRLVPVEPARHAAEIFADAGDPAHDPLWTYMAYGPFRYETEYRQWLDGIAASEDPLFHAIIDAATSKAAGVASYLRIDPAAGSIEVGHIFLGPRLQRSTAATETMYLMMRRAFDELGYRRYEWKCDALNAPSRRAALRLGFQFEGIFRQATVYKQRNRDTAWFAVTDRDWPRLKAGFEAWLAPGNFDTEGRQKTALEACFPATA